MKKLLIPILLFFPSIVFASFTVPMQATSTTQGWVAPARVNGVDQAIIAPYFMATSTTASSTLSRLSTVGIGTSWLCLSTDCRTIWPTTSGTGFPFSADSNYAQVVYSTSTPTLWFKNGLFASSTSNIAYASTTQISSTGSTYLATIDGNVGIGTTNPSVKLDVLGSTRFGDHTTNYSEFSSTGNLTMTGSAKYLLNPFLLGVGQYAFAADVIPLAGLMFQPVGYVFTDPSGGAVLAISPSDGNTSIGTGSAGFLGLNVLNVYGGVGIGTNYARLSAPANGMIVENNVGIGTSSPYAKLSVVGQVVGEYFTATTSTASSFRYASTTAISSSALTSGRVTYAGTGGILQDSANLTFTGTTLTVKGSGTAGLKNFVLLDSNNLGLVTVLDNGNAGIGSTTPVARLSVSNRGGTIPQFIVASSTGSTATTTSFIVDRFGNTGVGTTTPGALFAVAGNGLIGGRLAVRTVSLTANNLDADIFTVVGGPGIGTNNPGQNITLITGNARAATGSGGGAFNLTTGNGSNTNAGNGGNVIIQTGNGGDDGGGVIGPPGNITLDVGSGSGAATAFSTNRSKIMLGLSNNARILIGTSTIKSTLTVQGTTTGKFGSVYIASSTGEQIWGLDYNGRMNYKYAGISSLSSGTVTITPGVPINTNTIINLTLQSCSTCGTPYISATTSTTFTISSTNILDTSMVGWMLLQFTN